MLRSRIVAMKGAAFFEQGWVVLSRGCVCSGYWGKKHGLTFHPSPHPLQTFSPCDVNLEDEQEVSAPKQVKKREIVLYTPERDVCEGHDQK